MKFFGLFKSRQERDAELKTRVRQGTMRIQKFVNQLSKQSDNYASLARRAYDLDDLEQFRQLACGYLQCCETINRWERYMVKLKALELRRHEAEATQEFLSSMNSLTSAILNGVKPEDVMLLSTEMDAAIQRSEDLDDALAIAMDDAVQQVDGIDTNPEFLRTAVSQGSYRIDRKLSKNVDGQDDEFWSAVKRQRFGESDGESDGEDKKQAS